MKVNRIVQKRSRHKIRKIDCPYCGIPMKYLGAERIQLGKWSLLFEHADNFFSGVLRVQIYECPHCHKLEFFRSYQ